jgi:calcineurin-like phosphoesterase
LTYIKTRTNIILIDFHAEATSEKKALGFYLDGKVSGVFGTHTHVQTADAQILPKGTAYMTDLGCCGAMNSIIGMQTEGVLKKFLYFQKMGKFDVEQTGPFELNGACITIDCATGLATAIEGVRVVDEELYKNLSIGAGGDK